MTSAHATLPAGPSRAWLEWAEWLALLAALGCWLISASYTPVMMVGVACLLVSWLARFGRTGQFVAPTALDLPLVVFLSAALIGLWVAPDGPAALVRLYWFSGAAALYLALAGSRAAVLRWAALGCAVAGSLLAVYFVTQNPWGEADAKFALINRLGQAISALAPDLGGYKPHPNVVASLLAVLLPSAAALAVQAVRSRRGWQFAGAAGLVGVLTLGLLFTESRTSILAVGVAGAVGGWGWLAHRLARRPGWAFGPIFAVPIVSAVVLIGLLLALRPDLTAGWLGTLPGPNSAVSRQEVFGQAWRLAQDVAFTGGGLASFPARYSSYVLDVPVIYLTHAHNAYLNVLVEQGWLGLAGYVGLLLGAAGFGLRRVLHDEAPDPALALAGLLGLVVVMVQGLGDATLVASRVTPFWLIPAGLALGGGVKQVGAASHPPARQTQRWVWVAVAAGLVALGAIGWSNRGAWHANLGALSSDRVLLHGFPTEQWHTGAEAPDLRAAEPELEQALALDPDNRTAHFYLGLAAMRRRDYEAAVAQLAAAHAADPDQRGIRKVLGYSLTWLGRYAEAAEMLRGIPEARQEMEVYVWWWGTQTRPDLADNAAAMLAYWQAGG